MTDPSIETIVDINPELIIAATHYKEEVLKKLQTAKIGIVLENSPNTLKEIMQINN